LGSPTDYVAKLTDWQRIDYEGGALSFQTQRWNRRRARQFGLGGTFMAPIERFFLATTVSGFLGLIGSIVWLMVR
jgi:hypothetical protein